MHTILIQEGDQSIREIFSTFLEMVGYHVKTLRLCDEKLLEWIDQYNPALVILDFCFLGTAASAMCRQIKLLRRDLPVLAMSCNSNIGAIYQQHGFDGFVAKPFDLDVLENQLSCYILGHAQAEQQV